MNKMLLALISAAGVMLAAQSFAQAPAAAPAGSTAMCKDGTYFSGATKKGACAGHHGVKDWYGAVAAAPAAATPAAPAAKATKDQPAPGKTKKAEPVTTAPAAGGGPGQVWANDSTKVYHCPGDRWYGKTKHGEYLSEADAKSKGFHGDHGKVCK